jgi:catechol 2,3-dioxygenase
MMEAKLPDAFRLGPAALRVANADRALDFYEKKIGLEVLEHGNERLTLGAGDAPLLYLDIRPGIAPRNYKETGLYHVAILVPDRPSLGAAIARLNAHGVRLGAADHLVSEAIYVWDPDNNGIEIYRDRPRGEWTWHGGQVQMASRPLDFPGLLADADAEKLSRAPMQAGTRIGHIHLQVDDLAQAKKFYGDVFGFAPTATLPGALFMSAGGYHHHLGANVWESRNAPPASPDTAGLSLMTVELPDTAAIDALQTRLEAANVAVRKSGSGFSFADPWHTPVAVQLRASAR